MICLATVVVFHLVLETLSSDLSKDVCCIVQRNKPRQDCYFIIQKGHLKAMAGVWKFLVKLAWIIFSAKLSKLCHLLQSSLYGGPEPPTPRKWNSDITPWVNVTDHETITGKQLTVTAGLHRYTWFFSGSSCLEMPGLKREESKKNQRRLTFHPREKDWEHRWTLLGRYMSVLSCHPPIQALEK